MLYVKDIKKSPVIKYITGLTNSKIIPIMAGTIIIYIDSNQLSS